MGEKVEEGAGILEYGIYPFEVKYFKWLVTMRKSSGCVCEEMGDGGGEEERCGKNGEGNEELGRWRRSSMRDRGILRAVAK